MKINKIYANRSFKDHKYNPGFNVILGMPEDKSEMSRDTHNLGKTSLLHVIDFLLLRGLKKGSFLKKYSAHLTGYSFFGEFIASKNRYFLINRSLEENTKVNIYFSDSEMRDFDTDINWTHQNISLPKAKDLINEYLSFDITSQWNYRKSVGYFLRSQSDYNSIFKLNKFKGKDIEWKPFLFNLLGFDSKVVDKKYSLDDKKKSLNDHIRIIEEEFTLDSGKSDKLKGIIQIKTEELETAQKKLNEFKFYLEDAKLNKNLLDELDKEISYKNTVRYNLSSELQSIELSLKEINGEEVDLEKLKNLYKEVKIVFPDKYIKSLEDLQSFKKKITAEREVMLKQRHKEVSSELKKIDLKLRQLDEKKSVVLEVLKDKDSYEKFMFYQNLISEAKAEIARLTEKLGSMMKVQEIEERIDEIGEEIKEVKVEIKESIDDGNDTYETIRSNFNSFVKAVFNVPAVISISQNNVGNIEFNADVQNPKNMEVTAEGYGTTYKKMLCALFDLALLVTYSDKNFYSFAYHDGILEGLDDRKKVNFLKLIRELVNQFNIQYILTSIDSDLPKDESGKVLEIKDSDIILKLHDKDDKGKLFEKSF